MYFLLFGITVVFFSILAGCFLPERDLKKSSTKMMEGGLQHKILTASYFIYLAMRQVQVVWKAVVFLFPTETPERAVSSQRYSSLWPRPLACHVYKTVWNINCFSQLLQKQEASTAVDAVSGLSLTKAPFLDHTQIYCREMEVSYVSLHHRRRPYHPLGKC